MQGLSLCSRHLHTHTQDTPQHPQQNNSALTPYRSYFRALTGGLLVYLLYSQGLNKRTLTTLLLSGAFAASQDVLALHNNGELLSISSSSSSLVQDNKNNNKLLTLLLRLQRHKKQQQHLSQPAAVRTTLKVEGMRCEAW